jgi:hypothetical protein
MLRRKLPWREHPHLLNATQGSGKIVTILVSVADGFLPHAGSAPFQSLLEEHDRGDYATLASEVASGGNEFHFLANQTCNGVQCFGYEESAPVGKGQSTMLFEDRESPLPLGEG